MTTRTSTRKTLNASLAIAIATALHAVDNAGAATSKIREYREFQRAHQQRLENAWSLQKQSVQATPRERGNVLPVTSCEDDGSAGTLRSAILSAVTGDIVDMTQLSCGTITLTQGYLVDNYAQEISLLGPGMDKLTISANGKSNVLIHWGAGVLSMSDLSIADGYADDAWGGCLLASSGGFSLTRVRVSGCTAHQRTMSHGSGVHGGGIFAWAETTLVESIVSGNTLSSELSDAGPYSNMLSGGGLAVLVGPLSIESSRIQDNSIVATQPISGGGTGGGVWVVDGNLTITRSSITGNSISTAFIDGVVHGGGIAAETQLGTAISYTTISDNHISAPASAFPGGGGGLYVVGQASIVGSTISGNSTTMNTGAIHASTTTFSLVNSTVSGNSSSAFGAIMVTGNVEIANSTIAFNGSQATVGGLFSNGASMSLRSTIVAGNTLSGAPGDLIALGNGSIAGSHNIIVSPLDDTDIPDDTIIADPGLQPLSDNGGATRTHALGIESVAIDAGDNPLALDHDQRGEGYDRVSGDAADIGAFEAGPVSIDLIFRNGFDAKPPSLRGLD